MYYRKLWLKNSLNNVFEFTEQNSKHFLDNLSGLGFTKNLVSERRGNKEPVISEQVNINEISGSLIFYEKTNTANYQDYYDFIQFIKYKPLELYQLPPNTLTAYYCPVTITKLDKTQGTNKTTLECPITFKPTEHWKTESTNTIVLTNQTSGNSKGYLLEHQYAYGLGGLTNARLINTGTEDVGVKIEITGTASSTLITLFDNNNVMYGVSKLTGTFDYIMIDSDENNENIYMESNGLPISNAVSYQDFDYYESLAQKNLTTTYLRLQPGQSIINFIFNNEFDGYVTISWKPMFATV